MVCPAAADTAASHNVMLRIQLGRECSLDALAAGRVTSCDGLLGAADHGLGVPLEPQPPHLQPQHSLTDPGPPCAPCRHDPIAARLATVAALRTDPGIVTS